MRKQFYKMSMLGAGLIFSLTASAQLDVVTFMKSGASDANLLINGYMKPMFDGFGASMNNGWYNTGKVHGIGGFDVTVTMNSIMVSDNMKTFDVAGLGLNTDPNKPRLIPSGGGAYGTSPTIYGENVNGVKMDVWQRVPLPAPLTGYVDTMVTSFEMPPGTGTPVGIGLPNAQLAFGVGFGTELMVRYMPPITAGDFKINMFGFGVKHSISQWIWKDKVPVDLSAFFGYNRINSEFGFGENYLKPDSAYNGVLSDADYKNSQKITFSGNGLTIGAIVSKKLLFITPYLGASFSNSSVTMKMAGKYPVTFVDTDPTVGGSPNPNLGKPYILNYEDPISIESKLSYFRFTAGLRMKILILTIGGEYNIGKVNTLGFNVGVNLQSIKPFKL